MKEVSLVSIISAFKLNVEIFKSYLEYYVITINNEELKDLEVFYTHLRSLSGRLNIYEKYFIGYTIPQIGKEFDLLRIDDSTIVNIELKKHSTLDKIEKQLLRNKYYLGFLDKNLFLYTYVANERKLYKIDSNDKVVEADIIELIKILEGQNVKSINDINSYFVPSNYLVSPFNTTYSFVDGKYFLTSSQEDIKNQILKECETPNYSILSIKGNAGTGKTLLTYDIAKTIRAQKKVLIIHCGYLNNGHIILRDEYEWDIIPAKYIRIQDYSEYHMIIVDEAQRIFVNQLDYIIGEIKKYGNNCIFSYDGLQTLKQEEINNKIEEKIESKINSKPFELTNKIRTNKEVAAFIKCLFSSKRPIEKFKYENIEINYFDSSDVVKVYINKIKNEGWKIINYTPCRTALTYNKHFISDESDNAHTVVGQEFDNVVAVIDEHFYYENNELSTRASHYLLKKMLFQIVSRTRMKLKIIILNNPIILSRCLDILKQ